MANFSTKCCAAGLQDKYSSAGGIISGSWRVLTGQTIVSCNDIPLIGWFGNEFGRALVSCAEIGIQSGS